MENNFVDGKRVCKGCNKRDGEVRFHAQGKSSPDGKAAWCTICVSIRGKKNRNSGYTNGLFVDGKRVCKGCNKKDGEVEFNTQTHRSPDGKKAWCKTCQGEKLQESRRQTHSHYLKRTYQISIEDYDSILEAQGGMCAMPGCGSREPGGGRMWFAVDHDHRCCVGSVSCGKCIRGLLCGRCNMSLSLVDRVGIDSVREYLAKGDAYVGGR